MCMYIDLLHEHVWNVYVSGDYTGVCLCDFTRDLSV
jgi:hypothetical protein